MAMMTCKECKQPMSDSADACPHCGFKRWQFKFRHFLLILFGIPFFYVMTYGGRGDPPKITAGTPTKPPPKVDVAASRAADGAVQLRKGMREPGSFKLESALVLDGSNTVCYEYRARNGFGGMNVEHAVLTPADKLDTSAAAWDRHCGGKYGRDVSAAIRMFIL